MEVILRWRDLEYPASVDDKGELHLICPWCVNRSAYAPYCFRLSGNQVRSTGVMTCPYEECGLSFEIIHGQFVLWEPLGLDMWQRHRRLFVPQLMSRVWKTHNERRKRE